MKKLITLLIAIPLFAGGKAWMSLGYGTSSQMYDSTGKAVNLPFDASVSTLNLHLGGVYDIYSLPTFTLFGGVDLGLSQHSSSYTVFNTEISQSSNFSMQNVSVFFGAKALFLKAKLGFLLDVGPEPDVVNDKITNSDKQNAILISISGNLPNPMFSLGLGVDYFLTLENQGKTIMNWQEIEGKYDLGDYFSIKVKGGYKFAVGEAGVGLIYRMRTKAKFEGNEISNTDGNQLSLIPYIIISPPLLPVSFFLKGAVYDEYLPYGFSIMGKNDYVTRLGFTLGGVFKF